MQNLDVDSFAVLVRTSSVHRVYLTPYPAIDGGGWYLDCDHKDLGMTRDFRTKRGELRIFKLADSAIKVLRDCGYGGHVVVVMAPERGK